MTPKELTIFLDAHDHRCDICKCPEDWTKRSGGLVIDHDHKCCGSQDPRIPSSNRPKQLCGKCARGLLCYSCNAAIGQLAEDRERFISAMAYLGFA